jgi:Uma2 family endonuclease
MITSIMATIQQITTARQLLETPDLGRCELVRGELIMMSPAGFEHGRIVVNITLPLGNFVKERKLGLVTGAETGFLIAHDPDTVRAPDVGFVRTERVPPSPVRGFFPGAPDLAVEVLSPDDRPAPVLAKVHDWLAAGCVVVWVVDPEKQTASVYRSGEPALVRGASDELTCDDLLPGFRLPVAEIFAA